MGKTGAQRQAAYRAKRPFAGEGENGERRLSTWVNTSASLALARLARHNGLSKRQMLEQLIRVADDATLAAMASDSPAWDAYFGV
jgi:hypothetical protein